MTKFVEIDHSYPPIDYPTAWAITRLTDPEAHVKLCSYRQTNGAMRCDCHLLRNGWEALGCPMSAVEVERAAS